MIEIHDLHHEFPELEKEIHHLILHDAHFARLFKDYHLLDQEVHRIEVGVEATSDAYLEQQKLARLYLKDELYTLLKKVQLSA
jgi:uncharacterized protein YdcH (DUF465 family)